MQISQILDKTHVKIGLNTIYQIAGRFITALTGLLINRIIIEKIGLTGFGNYQIIITYVTIYWLLTDFGLNAVVVREMGEKPEKENDLFGSLITLRTGLGIILGVISAVVLAALPYSQELKTGIIIGMVTFITQGIIGSAHGLFQNRLRYELLFFANLISSICYLGLTYYILQIDGTVLNLIWVFVIGQLINMSFSIYFSTHLARFHFNLDFKLLKKIAITTLPFGLSLLLNLGNFKVDAFLLSVLKLPDYSNAEAVGLYNTAYKFFEFALIMPTFLMNAVYPIMVREFDQSLNGFRKIFWQSAGILGIISVSGLVVGYFLSPWVVSWVADSVEFTESVAILRLLLLWTPVFFISALLMWTVLTFHLQKALVWIYGAAFAINLGLNLVFIPKYSFYAAAMTTGISELFILIALAYMVFKNWPQNETR